MDQPISNIDILKKLKGKTNVVFYEDLHKYTDINQLLKFNSCVLLYKVQPSFGHWTALIRNNFGIEFFDPYGEKPDETKSVIDKYFLQQTNQYENYLCNLLYKASFKTPIEFNHFKFQKKAKNINTCGKHVIARILYKDLSLEDYNKFITSQNMNPDLFVTKLYQSII